MTSIMSDAQADLDKLVIIRSGLDGHQANMFKLNLEGQGIPAFLANDNVGSLNFVSHTDLFVKAKDWRAAEQFLSKVDVLPKRRRMLDPDGEEHACRHCGSNRVHSFVGEVPTLVPFVRLEASADGGWFHCLECDSYFREGRRQFAGLPIALAWSLFMGGAALGVVLLINWLKYL